MSLPFKFIWNMAWILQPHLFTLDFLSLTLKHSTFGGISKTCNSLGVKRYTRVYLRYSVDLVSSGSPLGTNKGKANKEIFVGIISKLYRIQGTNITNAITIGSKTVQQKDINWSNRIRGKDARTQIKVNIRAQDLNPKERP